MLVREVLVDERSVGSELAEDLVRALDPVEVDHLRRSRVDGSCELGRPEDERLTRAHVANGDHAGRLRSSIGGVDGDRREVVLGCYRVVADEDLVHRPGERLHHASGERRDERHEREPDHQGSGGRGGALRIPPRVVPSECTRRSTEARARPPEQPRQARDQRGREHRDADEDEHHPEDHEKENLGRIEIRPEEPPEEAGEAEDGNYGSDGSPEAGEPARGDRRSFSHGGDRGHSRRLEGREDAGDQRHGDSQQQRDDDRSRAEDEAAVRQREPNRVEQLEQSRREREAEEQPDDRRYRAHHERLDDDGEAHLPPRCAERPERRELTRALRDRDREGVEDDEGADEERDHAKREQEVAQKRDELIGVLRVLGGLLGAGSNLRTVGQDRVDLRDELPLGDTRLTRNPDLVELADLPEELLRCDEIESGQGRAADRVDRAKLDEAGDLELLDRPFCLDTDRVANREILLRRGGDVDHDLAVRGPPAVLEGEGVELGLGRINAEPQVRRTAENDRLAVLADQLGLAGDAANRRRNTRQCSNLRLQ